MLRRFFAIASLTPFLLRAQAPSAFEVASVRLIPTGSSGITSFSPPGAATFTASHVTLQILISMAYGVASDLVSGPSWIESQQYDVTAKPEGGGALTQEQLKPLLQKLLEQRFQLAVHRETKQVQGYALVVAKDGPKLAVSKGGAPHSYTFKGAVDVKNLPVGALAGAISRPVGRPVVDSTGIQGNYDIKLEFAPEGAANPTLPSIFTALQEQLGLKLTAQKVPAEMLAIDHVEKIPTEN